MTVPNREHIEFHVTLAKLSCNPQWTFREHFRKMVLTEYEAERHQLLHEMRTIRAKIRLGHVVTGERRKILKAMVAIRKARNP